MKTHQLGRQIGTDSNFVHATHTGHSNKNVKAIYSPGDFETPGELI